jgi:hypothetical protein
LAAVRACLLALRPTYRPAFAPQPHPSATWLEWSEGSHEAPGLLNGIVVVPPFASLPEEEADNAAG